MTAKKSAFVLTYKYMDEVERVKLRRLIYRRGHVKIYETADGNIVRLAHSSDNLAYCARVGTETISMYCLNFTPLMRVIDTNNVNLMPTRDLVYISTMYRGRPLSLFVHTRRSYNLQTSLFLQMLLPLVALHKHSLLHCDVKLENYIIADQKDAKSYPLHSRIPFGDGCLLINHNVDDTLVLPMLIDFDTLNRDPSPLSEGLCGTCGYRAPEHYFVPTASNPAYTQRSEAFAYGMTVLAALLAPCMTIQNNKFRAPAEFIEEAAGCMCSMSERSEAYHKAYSSDGCVETVADYAWRTALVLGYPGENSQDDLWVLSTPLGRVLAQFREQLVSHQFYRWPNHTLASKSARLDSLLESVLQWTPSNRKTCTELLSAEYFRDVYSTRPPERRWADLGAVTSSSC